MSGRFFCNLCLGSSIRLSIISQTLFLEVRLSSNERAALRKR